MITILAMQIWQQSGQYVYVLAQFASILLVNVSRIFHSKRFYTEFYTEIRDYLVLLQRSRTDAKKKAIVISITSTRESLGRRFFFDWTWKMSWVRKYQGLGPNH